MTKKENERVRTKDRFSYKGVDCYIITTTWFEKQGTGTINREKKHQGVAEDLDFETSLLPTYAEAKKQLIKHIDEGLKDIGMNSLSKKKLAVIKSNAKPEVKLKALEKLNSPKHNAASLDELRKLAQSMANSLQKDVSNLKEYVDQMQGMAKSSKDEITLQSIINDCKDIKNALGRVI